MNDRFEEFFNLLMKLEGGEVNDKNDRGGHTNFGITQYLYDRVRNKRKLPRQSVSLLTTDEAKNIYATEFFAVVLYIEDKERHYNYFDMCVNSGHKNYLKLAAANPDDIYKWRQNFFDKIIENDVSQKVNKKGWYNRLARIKNYFNN